MAKYLCQVMYGQEGLAGLLKEGGTGRRKATEKLFDSVGGKVESFYYAFGDVDLFAIVDVPDNISMAAVSLVVNSAAAVSATVTPLLTAEEIDAAAKKSADYRPPGK